MTDDIAASAEEDNRTIQMLAAAVFPLALAGRYLWAVIYPYSTRGWDEALIVVLTLEVPLLIVRAIVVRIVDSGEIDAKARLRKFFFWVFIAFVVISAVPNAPKPRKRAPAKPKIKSRNKPKTRSKPRQRQPR